MVQGCRRLFGNPAPSLRPQGQLEIKKEPTETLSVRACLGVYRANPSPGRDTVLHEPLQWEPVQGREGLRLRRAACRKKGRPSPVAGPRETGVRTSRTDG